MTVSLEPLDDNLAIDPISTEQPLKLKNLSPEDETVKTHEIGPKTIQEIALPSGGFAHFSHEITEPPTGSSRINTIAEEAGVSKIDTSRISENLIVELQKLIAQVFAQLARISESDSAKTEAMQKKYLALTKESADLMRKTGNAGPLISGVSCVIIMASHYGLKEDGQKLGKFVADQVPQIASMFTSNYQAIIKQKDNAASLELQKYIDKIGKNQSDGNKRQDYIKLLEAALESQKRASQAG